MVFWMGVLVFMRLAEMIPFIFILEDNRTKYEGVFWMD